MTWMRNARALATATLCLSAVFLSIDSAAARTLRNDGVGSSNPRYPGATQANRIAPGFGLVLRARGTAQLENPSGVITHFGYLNDSSIQKIEASKTEPDENTYLVLDHNPGGPKAGFDYGRHFLFQGHENANDLAYLTRINLDINDPAHRITLLTPVGADGKTHFNRIDGSTWDPFTKTLLFTQEGSGTTGGVIEIPADYGKAAARTLYGSLGRGGFEGIHPDDKGNLFIVEDIGGTSVSVNPADPASPKAAKLPNSFLYRFVPATPGDLTAGKLQALQVTVDGAPVPFVPIDAAHPTGDVFSNIQLKLHTRGTSWPVQWVTIHDTAVNGTAEFDANAAAKAAGATPFKRPENGQFIPGTGFQSFVFVTTYDTSVDSANQPALAARGAWGGLFRLDLDSGRATGTISLVYLGDADHTAFDNVTFASDKIVLLAEDRGDLLHRQLSKLDSVWALDITTPGASPARLLALGRDPASTVDAGYLEAGTPGFQNDGDNEPTGLHVSDGDPTVQGLVGSRIPLNARWFVTQQHGRNFLYEIVGDDLNVQ